MAIYPARLVRDRDSSPSYCPSSEGGGAAKAAPAEGLGSALLGLVSSWMIWRRRKRGRVGRRRTWGEGSCLGRGIACTRRVRAMVSPLARARMRTRKKAHRIRSTTSRLSLGISLFSFLPAPPTSF